MKQAIVFVLATLLLQTHSFGLYSEGEGEDIIRYPLVELAEGRNIARTKQEANDLIGEGHLFRDEIDRLGLTPKINWESFGFKFPDGSVKNTEFPFGSYELITIVNNNAPILVQNAVIIDTVISQLKMIDNAVGYLYGAGVQDPPFRDIFIETYPDLPPFRIVGGALFLNLVNKGNYVAYWKVADETDRGMNIGDGNLHRDFLIAGEELPTELTQYFEPFNTAWLVDQMAMTTPTLAEEIATTDDDEFRTVIRQHSGVQSVVDQIASYDTEDVFSPISFLALLPTEENLGRTFSVWERNDYDPNPRQKRRIEYRALFRNREDDPSVEHFQRLFAPSGFAFFTGTMEDISEGRAKDPLTGIYQERRGLVYLRTTARQFEIWTPCGGTTRSWLPRSLAFWNWDAYSNRHQYLLSNFPGINHPTPEPDGRVCHFIKEEAVREYLIRFREGVIRHVATHS